MEKGEGSKQQKRCITSSPSSAGLMVTREANADSNITNGTNDDVPFQQQTFGRGPDQYVPLANLTRIMRSILPPHAKIADDAKETIQECVSEFISFVTTEANARCHSEQRKTIYAEDVLSAMGTLGFENYKECLAFYLKMRRTQDMGRRQATMPVVSRGTTNFSQPSAGQLPPQSLNFTANAPPDYAQWQPALPIINESNANGEGEREP